MTRARSGRGDVGPEEAARLAAGFGAYLRCARLERGLTQAALAAAAGLSAPFVGDLEIGRFRPSDRSTARLAAALRPGADALTVAVEDVRLRRLAGESLRPLKRRRRNPGRERLLAEAAAVLDAMPGGDGRATAEAFAAVFGDVPPRIRSS
ncbi:helix-turn-helix domain-containing protein [Pseudonocardia alni]|uniref:helix-turn-helix domain-containing protein n=1 Tax=Pseudonocardia alni TaxID=33907 RepID=UPI003327E55E